MLAVVVSGAIGWFMGGADRGPVVRTTAIVGVPRRRALIALDKYMSYWEVYANSSRVRGRPIATVGASTPGLGGNFWVQGIDLYTHLLLPTIAIILISFASYTRYSRASLLEVMNQDYIRTARAKGLTAAHRHRASRVPQRADPDHDDHRVRHRRDHRRRGRHRDGLRLERHGPPVRRRTRRTSTRTP